MSIAHLMFKVSGIFTMISAAGTFIVLLTFDAALDHPTFEVSDIFTTISAAGTSIARLGFEVAFGVFTITMT